MGSGRDQRADDRDMHSRWGHARESGQRIADEPTGATRSGAVNAFRNIAGPLVCPVALSLRWAGALPVLRDPHQCAALVGCLLAVAVNIPGPTLASLPLLATAVVLSCLADRRPEAKPELPDRSRPARLGRRSSARPEPDHTGSARSGLGCAVVPHWKQGLDRAQAERQAPDRGQDGHHFLTSRLTTRSTRAEVEPPGVRATPEGGHRTAAGVDTVPSD